MGGSPRPAPMSWPRRHSEHPNNTPPRPPDPAQHSHHGYVIGHMPASTSWSLITAHPQRVHARAHTHTQPSAHVMAMSLASLPELTKYTTLRSPGILDASSLAYSATWGRVG